VTRRDDQAARTCGRCAACCHVPPVPDVAKAACSDCHHLRLGARRCGVYATRPAVCREYECLWLVDPDFPPHMRPDLSGVIFDLQDTERSGQVLRCMEVRPGVALRDWLDVLVQLSFKLPVSVIEYGQDATSMVVVQGRVVRRA
jgi:hypothetical protein